MFVYGQSGSSVLLESTDYDDVKSICTVSVGTFCIIHFYPVSRSSGSVVLYLLQPKAVLMFHT